MKKSNFKPKSVQTFTYFSLLASQHLHKKKSNVRTGPHKQNLQAKIRRKSVRITLKITFNEIVVDEVDKHEIIANAFDDVGRGRSFFVKRLPLDLP